MFASSCPRRQSLKPLEIRYATLEPGLEREFYRSVAVCVEQIRRDPEAYPPLTEDVRKIRTRRFPYVLLYAVEGETVFVLRL
jgi:mRNA-degrading endonuclease RelE of RelBE toxin-antitoxin system